MRWFHVEKTGRDCSSYLPGLYTVSELDQMIFVDGYIPVAQPEELDEIRNSTPKTMGAGTCWENTYTTGNDKKYVQVLAIDATPISNFIGLGDSTSNRFSGTYDGNNLAITNMYNGVNSTQRAGGMFGYTDTPTVLNLRLDIIQNGSTATTAGNSSLFVDFDGVLINAIVSVQVNSVQSVGGVVYDNHGTISDCKIDINQLDGTSNSSTGGICRNNYGVIERTITTGVIGTGANRGKGGFVYDNKSTGEIRECASFTTIKRQALTNNNIGIFFVLNSGLIEDCYAQGETINTRDRVGGFGYSNAATGIIVNCYSASIVDSDTTTNVKDGIVLNSGTITSYYYDDTISPYTGGQGIAKTTSELQTPTSATGIYATWNPLIWDFGTSSEYPKLINTP